MVLASSGMRYQSRPHYSGLFSALLAFIPSSFLLVVFSIGDDLVFQQLALDFIQKQYQQQKISRKSLFLLKLKMWLMGSILESSQNGSIKLQRLGKVGCRRPQYLNPFSNRPLPCWWVSMAF